MVGGRNHWLARAAKQAVIAPARCWFRKELSMMPATLVNSAAVKSAGCNITCRGKLAEEQSYFGAEFGLNLFTYFVTCKRNYSSSTVTVIKTSCTGTSLISTGTLAILSITSRPSVTSPKTVYFVSSEGTPPIVV